MTTGTSSPRLKLGDTGTLHQHDHRYVPLPPRLKLGDTALHQHDHRYVPPRLKLKLNMTTGELGDTRMLYINMTTGMYPPASSWDVLPPTWRYQDTLHQHDHRYVPPPPPQAGRYQDALLHQHALHQHDHRYVTTAGISPRLKLDFGDKNQIFGQYIPLHINMTTVTFLNHSYECLKILSERPATGM